MEKGFYHPSTGYWQTISDPSPEIRQSYPAGTIEIPVKPGPGYTYDGTAWIAPTQEVLDEIAAKRVRGQRAVLLATVVDPVVTNPLRWNSLSAEKQQAYADYRQALLDITLQSGFPHNVVWPAKPE